VVDGRRERPGRDQQLPSASLSLLAASTVLRIYDASKSLKRFPERGRPGRLNGTRELVLAPLPYLILYSVRDDSVNVLRILHGAQERLFESE